MISKLNFWAGFWRLADPKISLASMASIFLGACAAASAGYLNFYWLIITIIGIFAIEVAKNASGEVFDFDSGNDQAVSEKDRSPFSGGKRVLVDGLLTRAQVIGIASVCYLIGIATGLIIVFYKEPMILWIGMIGVGAAFLYHAPPLKLSYRGLGEIAVAFCYGPLISIGTFLVQGDELPASLLFTSSILGLLIGNFLLINEFPDHHADTHAKKMTLVVRLGRATAARLFSGIFGLSLILLLLLPFNSFATTLLLGLIALPTGFSASNRLHQDHEHTANIIPAQAQTLITFLLFAIGAGIGYLIA
jgi:1,4-dihydroxy-2-naphthoate octaprenyltransferase